MRRLSRHLGPLLITLAVLLPGRSAHGQWPPEVQNLQVLPDDIPFRELVDVMAGFTRALAVRCSFCHVGEEGAPLSSYDFASDDKLTKRKARRMLQMVQAINEDHLSDLEERVDPPVRVECATCHRAAQQPRMLQDILSLAYDAGGYDSAVAVYTDLRERFYGRYTYDFSNIVLPDVATRLIERGALADAVRLLQLNVTLFPDSEFARRQYASAALQEALQTDGFDAAMARYHALRDEMGSVPEPVLNGLGYRFLRGGQVSEAIQAFRLNVEVYPESANAYDSLGEAYMEHGDTELAIQNYERSLELDPSNANAAERLRTLRASR